jgi:hypothetical protein
MIATLTPYPTVCYDIQVSRATPMSDTSGNSLCALRHKDGSVTLYIDEEWAAERGVDPSQLVRVEIPRELYISGTVQQIREYVASYLESQEHGHIH